MKLFLSILLLAPVFASAATEIIYNRSANPYIPQQGEIVRENLCVEQDTNSLKVHDPEHSMKVPMLADKEVCVQWNRNDSSRPVCTRTVLRKVQLDDTYTQYTYDVWDVRKERPITVQNKRLENCNR
ncbi:hypothetical protein ACLVWU_04105 [Bdellovibrio sp. HCB290]|uniref:hypothetical protein n=1 Tax=Bdellovibrio sp. HCB290 TaxID=3394356 RepID=UPI0039B37BC2